MQRALTVEEICRKLKPVFGNKIDEIYLRYSMAESREEKEEIAHILNALYHKNLNKLLDKGVLLEPPVKELMEGEYPVAEISYAGKKLFPFNLRESDWPRHVCISGMSGSGKTTLALGILKNFSEKDKPFLVFDWKKSFRSLMNIDGEIMCFTIGNDLVSNTFRTNINQPPKGVPPKEWINILCDLFTETFFVSFGVHKVLLETLDEAFEEYGVYKGSENYPTWNHIRWRLEEKMKKTKGREAGWLESALRIATILTFGDFGKVLNYKGKDSFSVEELLDKKVIFELSTLGTIEKKIFCEFILTYIYKLKKANQDSTNEFKHAILVDEAHNIFLKDKTHFVKESITDMIYREVREYGTSLICLDQHISKISDTVKGNSACHIAFQQQLPQDIFEISGLMQLKERKEMFSQLPVGSAVVKLSERYTSPFLVEVPFIDLRSKSVGDREISERMKCISLGIEVGKEIDPEFSKIVMDSKKEKTTKNSELEDRLEISDNMFVSMPAVNIREKTEIKKPKIEKEKPKIKKTRKNKENIKEKIGEKTENNKLTPTQKILFEFVQKKLQEGVNLKEIEKILERNKDKRYFSDLDILQVINYAFEQKIKGSDKYLKDKNTDFSEDDVTNEEQKFIKFLKLNPNHQESTVNIYKILGLSTRKGNKIKNQLLEKGLIKVQEERNEKGWKKIIRLA